MWSRRPAPTRLFPQATAMWFTEGATTVRKLIRSLAVGAVAAGTLAYAPPALAHTVVTSVPSWNSGTVTHSP